MPKHFLCSSRSTNYALVRTNLTYWNFPIGIRSSSTAISVLVCFMICIYCSIELCMKFLPMYCRCRFTSTNSFLYKLWKHRTFALILIIIKVCACIFHQQQQQQNTLHCCEHRTDLLDVSCPMFSHIAGSARPDCNTEWCKQFSIIQAHSRTLIETHMRITSVVILGRYQIRFDVILDENRIFFRHFRARLEKVLIF